MSTTQLNESLSSPKVCTPNSSWGDPDGSLNRNITSILTMLESPLTGAKVQEDADDLIPDTQPIQFLKGKNVLF